MNTSLFNNLFKNYSSYIKVWNKEKNTTKSTDISSKNVYISVIEISSSLALSTHDIRNIVRNQNMVR